MNQLSIFHETKKIKIKWIQPNTTIKSNLYLISDLFFSEQSQLLFKNRSIVTIETRSRFPAERNAC